MAKPKSFTLDSNAIDIDALKSNLLERKITGVHVSSMGHPTLWLTFDDNTSMAIAAKEHLQPSYISFFEARS